MKKLFFTLLSTLLLCGVANAQFQSAYHVYPNPCDTSTTMDTYDSPAHGDIKNISNDTISMKWERHIISLTSNIETAVCDPVTCWFSSISTKTFKLAPDSSGQLTVHFYNNAYDPAPGMAGSGIVHLKLTNLKNAADSLTVVYTFNTLTATHEIPQPTVKLFPNPTTDFFTLERAEEVKYMKLYTLEGKVAATFTASPSNTYSIANQPVGNYVLSFEDKNGNMFQAVEIHKR